MDKHTIELLARRAGLDKALAEFPEDVAAAAELAMKSLAKLKPPPDPRAPAMSIGARTRAGVWYDRAGGGRRAGEGSGCRGTEI